MITVEDSPPPEMPEVNQPEQAGRNSTPPNMDAPPHMRTWGRLLMWGLVATILTLLGVWAFCSIFLSHLTVGRLTSSSRMSDASLSTMLDKQARDYRLTIVYPDKTSRQFSLDKLGLTVDSSASVEATRKRQHEWGNRLKWWQPVRAIEVVKVNNAVLNAFVATEATVTIQPPLDAVLKIEKGKIRITDAVAGKRYSLTEPQQSLLSSASDLRTDPLKLTATRVAPALTAGTLAPYKTSLEKIMGQPVTFTVGGASVTPSPDDIATWLEITPDVKSKKVDITVNSGKVLQYIDTMAAARIRPAKAQINILKADGTTNEVVAGVNGIDVINKASSAATVAKTLMDGAGIKVSLDVNYEPFRVINTNSYDKWIEVDLTHKTMYAYEKNNLVKTDLVSAGAPATPTVTGQYAIYAKYDQQDMRGNNVDGSKYFQPHVRWISYFYKDYAVHGNYWRPLSYFGNINSSHGCVSLVESEAAWMYNWAPIGTPVIVHK